MPYHLRILGTFIAISGAYSSTHWNYKSKIARDHEYEWITSVIDCKVNGPEKVTSKPPEPIVRPTDYQQ